MTWDEMKTKYGDLSSIDRSTMTLEEETSFVNDCFECYEKEGFAKKFWSPFSDVSDKIGQEFEVVGRLSPKVCDLCTLPQWEIKFLDGYIINAAPEEIIVSEMRANGCSLEDIE